MNLNRRHRGAGDRPLNEDKRAELAGRAWEDAELAMERDVLRRSVAFRVMDAMGRQRTPC